MALNPIRIDASGDDAGPRQAGARPSSARPVAAVESEVHALQALLRLERDARRAPSEAELFYLIANETRSLVHGRQFFVVARDADRYRIEAISSVSAVDREAPFAQWFEAMLARRFAAFPVEAVAFDLADEPVEDGDHAANYPFGQILVLPMTTRAGQALGALVIARESAWDEEGLRVGERLRETYAHAWSHFRRQPKLSYRMIRPARAGGLALLAFVVLGLMPTSLTALAPFEIVPDRPFVVAASSDGIIESVEVQPNTEVSEGQVLYRTVSTSPRDALVIAERAMAVADAKWKQYLQAAFIDPQAKRELAAAQAEFELKRAERDYARDLLDKTIVKAPRTGIVIFNDANDLAGRPVSTGQRIMEIADRRHVMVRINVPVEDSIVLRDGARAKVYLDSDPLHAVEATIAQASHGARLIEGNLFVYRADARLAADAEVPRLGVRGTAEIYGPRTSMLLFLFRRPLSYLRQHFGL